MLDFAQGLESEEEWAKEWILMSVPAWLWFAAAARAFSPCWVLEKQIC